MLNAFKPEFPCLKDFKTLPAREGHLIYRNYAICNEANLLFVRIERCIALFCKVTCSNLSSSKLSVLSTV
jgi:hypothetical protein